MVSHQGIHTLGSHPGITPGVIPWDYTLGSHTRIHAWGSYPGITTWDPPPRTHIRGLCPGTTLWVGSTLGFHPGSTPWDPYSGIIPGITPWYCILVSQVLTCFGSPQGSGAATSFRNPQETKVCLPEVSILFENEGLKVEHFNW